ncbi:MAG TPA: DUF3365 domain-containing protein [Longimicrobiales bacterium]
MRPRYPLLGMSVLVLSIACERTEPADTTAADEAAVAELGSAVAQQLRQTLVQRLTAAIDSSGPAHAIDVCALEAGALTDSIARDLGGGVAVKRTSARVRNPRNAPDSLEQLALEHFTTVAAATGTVPTHYVQRTGEREHRYYEPLGVIPLCVQCHGPPDSIAPDVRAVIAQRYPQDRATGYRVGDLRGLIRVTVPASRVR